MDWETVDMQEVRKIWHILQAIQLQPLSLAYTCSMVGMSHSTVETVIGSAAVAIFLRIP